MRKAIAFFSQPGSQWNPLKPMHEQLFWDDHARFFSGLFSAGKIILGGPFMDASGSMVIFNSDSIDDVRVTMREDPWAQRQILIEREIKEWMILVDVHDNA